MPKGIGYGKAARSKVSAAKARKILHDGKVNGKPLTDKQRRFFGAVMHKAQDGTAVGPSSRSLLMEGMQEGGVMTPTPSPTVPSAVPMGLPNVGAAAPNEDMLGLMAIQKGFQDAQARGFGQEFIAALKLGQFAARRQHRSALGAGGAAPELDSLLRENVARAFSALGGSAPAPAVGPTMGPPTVQGTAEPPMSAFDEAVRKPNQLYGDLYSTVLGDTAGGELADLTMPGTPEDAVLGLAALTGAGLAPRGVQAARGALAGRGSTQELIREGIAQELVGAPQAAPQAVRAATEPAKAATKTVAKRAPKAAKTAAGAAKEAPKAAKKVATKGVKALKKPLTKPLTKATKKEAVKKVAKKVAASKAARKTAKKAKKAVNKANPFD